MIEKTIVTIIVGVPLILYVLVANAFVLTYLWLWFVMPFFPVSALNIPQAIGFMLFVIAIRMSNSDKNKEDDWNWVAALFLRPWFMLGMGWIVKEYFL